MLQGLFGSIKISGQTKLRELSHQEKKEFLVSGYIKRYCDVQWIFLIPQDIVNLCAKFYENVQILPWSTHYVSPGSFVFSDHNLCVTRNEKTKHKVILPDMDPVFKGMHCWRVKVKNPKRGWIMFGISAPKIYDDASDSDSGYGQATVWGITYNSCWYGASKSNKHKVPSCEHFKVANGEIDIKLNATDGELNICIVGSLKDNKEVKYWELPMNTDHGWLPHFNIASGCYDSAANAQLRIAKIPFDWYGQKLDHDIFQKVL